MTHLSPQQLAAVTGGEDLDTCREYARMGMSHAFSGNRSLAAMYDGMSSGCRASYRLHNPGLFNALWSLI
jgi:hypothetical protein